MLLNKKIFALVLAAAVFAPLPASAMMRPDPLGYSGLFWPNYSIFGRKVSKKTKFGTLVCTGSGYKGSTQRSCHWK